MLATVTASALLFSSLTSIIVALPAVQRDLGLDSSALHWVVVAALLPLCALAVVSGRLGDTIGRRRVFLLGMACFVTGSALCAVATDGAFLVGARAVQGLGVALAVPLALANLTTALPAEKHGWAIGVQTTVISVVAIAMPLGIPIGSVRELAVGLCRPGPCGCAGRRPGPAASDRDTRSRYHLAGSDGLCPHRFWACPPGLRL
ncbi:hypothetical protein GCM10017776_59540 [Streptomyces griseoluteus]|nr:hypothetical protein GCM10017776_59540 [Streptomyces griseoluteus]